jgi:hypothetical protein
MKKKLKDILKSIWPIVRAALLIALGAGGSQIASTSAGNPLLM